MLKSSIFTVAAFVAVAVSAPASAQTTPRIPVSPDYANCTQSNWDGNNPNCFRSQVAGKPFLYAKTATFVKDASQEQLIQICSWAIQNKVHQSAGYQAHEELKIRFRVRSGCAIART